MTVIVLVKPNMAYAKALAFPPTKQDETLTPIPNAQLTRTESTRGHLEHVKERLVHRQFCRFHPSNLAKLFRVYDCFVVPNVKHIRKVLEEIIRAHPSWL